MRVYVGASECSAAQQTAARPAETLLQRIAALTIFNRCLSALRRATVTKVCAVWVGVLAALPFTAPFAALDAADFFSGARTHSLASKVSSSTPAPTQSDDVDDAAASEAISQRVHRDTLVNLVPIAAPVDVSPSDAADTVFCVTAAAVGTPPPHDASVAGVSLRV